MINALLPHRQGSQDLRSQRDARLATRAAGTFYGCCSRKGVLGRHLNPLAVPRIPSYNHRQYHLRSLLKLILDLEARAGRRKPRDLAGPSNPRHLGHHREPRIDAAEPITTRPLHRHHRLKHYP